MSGVSTTTVRRAAETVNALEGAGIEVAQVVFAEQEDSFTVELEDGGRIGPTAIGGGTVKDTDPDE